MEHINIKKNINIDINIRDVHRHQRYATIGKLKGVAHTAHLCEDNRTKPTGFSVQTLSNYVLNLVSSCFFVPSCPPSPKTVLMKSNRLEKNIDTDEQAFNMLSNKGQKFGT